MISVIIPTYKNKHLFIDNLKNNLNYLNDYQVIVINDDPTQSIKDDLKEFSNILLIENKNNLGFAKSINKGVKLANGKYLMLLNNDVRLKDDNYQLAINDFSNDPSLFAVSFAQKEKNDSIVGKNFIYWEKGFFKHKKDNTLTTGITAWAEGGTCLIDKKKFLELRGFDSLYTPFYWEDIDLSYRAWERGYTIIFNRSIEVIHYHESTIGKYYSSEKIAEIAFRNQLIFNWKHIDRISKLIEHLFYLIPTVTGGGWPYIIGLIQALLRLPIIIFKKIYE